MATVATETPTDESGPAEERNIQHRPFLPRLDDHEDDEQRAAGAEPREDQDAPPALGVSAQEPEDDQKQRRRKRGQPGEIGSDRADVARLGHPRPRDHARRGFDLGHIRAGVGEAAPDHEARQAEGSRHTSMGVGDEAGQVDRHAGDHTDRPPTDQAASSYCVAVWRSVNVSLPCLAPSAPIQRSDQVTRRRDRAGKPAASVTSIPARSASGKRF